MGFLFSKTISDCGLVTTKILELYIVLTSCPCFVFTFNWFSSGHGSGHRVNRLSSIKFFYVSWGRLGGLHHFQPSFGRGVFFAWCRKLHYNYFKPSDVRHIDRSYTFIPLSCL